MSVDRLTPEEERLIAAYPRKRIKRCALGATSGWDNRPFRERHSILLAKIQRRKRTSGPT